MNLYRNKMKFEDYFKEAIKYGESLGLRKGTEGIYADICVELDEPKLLKRKGNEPFYPSVLIMWDESGLDVKNFDMIHGLNITIEQQLKLVKMFISAYEQYLADKKEPVQPTQQNK